MKRIMSRISSSIFYRAWLEEGDPLSPWACLAYEAATCLKYWNASLRGTLYYLAAQLALRHDDSILELRYYVWLGQ